MGLASSRDRFVACTMKIISDLPGVQCLVDNILVSAENFSQLIHRLYMLLQRLQKNNATVSLKKIEIARSLDVAGMNVTCKDTGVEFRATEESLNAFARLREPTCKKELQSLLGMVNFDHRISTLHQTLHTLGHCFRKGRIGPGIVTTRRSSIV